MSLVESTEEDCSNIVKMYDAYLVRVISTIIMGELSSSGVATSSIPALVIEHADGNFLWASSIVERILSLYCIGAGMKEIEASVFSTPKQLVNLYKGLIEGTGFKFWRLILWECHSAGDYPSDDKGMQRRVERLGRGLIKIYPDTNLVQLIHRSIKDFLVAGGFLQLAAMLRSAESETSSQVDLEKATHDQLARTCIRYLAMDEVTQSQSEDPKSLKATFPFLHYATTSWVVHAQQSKQERTPHDDLLDFFGWPSEKLVHCWVPFFRALAPQAIDCPPEGTTMLHIVSLYGLIGSLKHILRMGNEIESYTNAMDCDRKTPLSWVGKSGQEAVVKLLLERDANVEAEDVRNQTPLSWAANNGHVAIVKLLLDKGANVSPFNYDHSSPLLLAANNGHEAIVELLLINGAAVTSTNARGRTPLLLASENGHAAIVKLLLGRSANIDVADDLGRTPLSWASENGHVAIVKLLLEKGAHINSADMDAEMLPLLDTKNGQFAIANRMLANLEGTAG